MDKKIIIAELLNLADVLDENTLYKDANTLTEVSQRLAQSPFNDEGEPTMDAQQWGREQTPDAPFDEQMGEDRSGYDESPITRDDIVIAAYEAVTAAADNNQQKGWDDFSDGVREFIESSVDEFSPVEPRQAAYEILDDAAVQYQKCVDALQNINPDQVDALAEIFAKAVSTILTNQGF